MTNSGKQDSRSARAARSSTSGERSRNSPSKSGSVATRFNDTLFRSRLEANWAAFFDAVGVEWEYEPKSPFRGWWPDFLVKGISVDGEDYNVFAEVKPVRFSPIAVDPSYAKALHPKWTLLLGLRPDGDYIGFLACKRDTLRTMAVRLTDEGLQAAAIVPNEYAGHAERVFSRTDVAMRSAGLSVAINSIIEKKMGKRLFHFGEEGKA